MKKQVSEGSLHKWFKGSKSKDGKGGWVNVVTGGTCASDKPGEGTPKCVSSSKRASMSKSERLSASRRKKKADPGQQSKSGAAKPTYVSTDKKKMKESYIRALTPLSEKAVKCWKGYEKKGTKKMFGKTVNNCVKKEEVDTSVSEDFYKKKYDVKKGGYVKTDKMDKSNKRSGDSKAQYREVHKDLAKEAYSANPKQQAAIAISKKDRLEKMLVAKKKKKQNVYSEMTELEMQKNAIKTGMMNGKKLTPEQIQGMKAGLTQGGNKLDENQTAIDLINKGQEVFDKVTTKKDGTKNLGGKIIDKVFGTSGGKNTINKKEYQDKINTQTNSYEPESETIEEGDKKGKGSGSKDACYHKVKSRYSVWPSAYASGALVKCRKVGAANWGNSSKKEDFSDWKAEFIWEDGDSAKKIDEASSPAWQRKEGKSESGGLNKKGVASYRAANPGSKLKTAVTTKPSKLKRGSKSAKRRKSFCSRMKGMKKKLTSAKTARDPDSRINKALRKWNC